MRERSIREKPTVQVILERKSSLISFITVKLTRLRPAVHRVAVTKALELAPPSGEVSPAVRVAGVVA
jgi:hypothetical protein